MSRLVADIRAIDEAVERAVREERERRIRAEGYAAGLQYAIDSAHRQLAELEPAVRGRLRRIV